MSAIVEAVLTDSSFENRELSYASLQRAKAARYCTLYDRLQIDNPKWRSADLCGTLGISAQRLNKYCHLLGAPKRVTKLTTEQKQAAQAKGMLTRSKNDAYKRYLAELREKNLEFPEMRRLLEERERGHGMPDMAPSHSSAVGGEHSSGGKGAPPPSLRSEGEDALRSEDALKGAASHTILEGRKSKRRGGRVPEFGAESPSFSSLALSRGEGEELGEALPSTRSLVSTRSLAPLFTEQQSDGETTGRLRGVPPEALAKADAAMRLLNERK